MSMRVGEFLRLKLGNMAKWVQTELGEQLTVNLELYVAERTETELACLAGILSTNSTIVHQRDWDGLAGLSSMPEPLQRVFELLRGRRDMHTKMWLYLELFIVAVNGSN